MPNDLATGDAFSIMLVAICAGFCPEYVLGDTNLLAPPKAADPV